MNNLILWNDFVMLLMSGENFTTTIDLRGKWLKKQANMDLGDWNKYTEKF